MSSSKSLPKSDFMGSRQEFAEVGHELTHIYRLGGVNLRIDFTIAHNGDITLHAVSRDRKKAGRPANERTLIQQKLTTENPILLGERSGPHAFNLVLEAEPLKETDLSFKGRIIRSFLIVHHKNDQIQMIPNLFEYKARVPLTARRYPNCFIPQNN